MPEALSVPMLNTYRLGDLYVAETAADPVAIQREIQSRDPRLRLGWYEDERGRRVWEIRCYVGEQIGADGYREIITHVDPQGNPLPLTWRIVDRLRELESRRGTNGTKERRDNYEALKERNKLTIRERAEDVAADLIPRVQGRKVALLHRGTYLRQSRDKRRAKGENI